MRVTGRGDRPFVEVAPGIRRAIYLDAAEGARSLSLGMAELDPGKEIPVHRHSVEEGVHVLEGDGVVVVGNEEHPVRAGSFCIMPAGEYHTVRNRGEGTMRIVMAFSGTDVRLERKP